MHVALVRSAMEQLQLDALHVFPTGHAWHKPRALTAAKHRLQMAEIAFDGIPGVALDAREIQRPGPTYTIDTLRTLQSELPRAELYLLMGADQASRFTSWQGWEEIARTAIISVALRADKSCANVGFSPEILPAGRWEMLQAPPVELSATDIRHRVFNSQGIAHLVPDGVARYIDQHHLYQTDR